MWWVQITGYIATAIISAWALISGATAVAGATLLAAALSALPGRMGSAPSAWLDVANWYLPLNETLSLFFIWLGVAGAVKFIKISAYFKK